jgi:hypothetical protein
MPASSCVPNKHCHQLITAHHVSPRAVLPAHAGADAYQRSKLGDKVTIERRIGNTNSWKLMDARGRTVGTKKREHIDPMLDHFSINAANPLAVMTQDTARTFLSGELLAAALAGVVTVTSTYVSHCQRSNRC